MFDGPANNPFDDVLEGEPTAEPAQLAVHGLLCVYYEIRAGVSTSRVDDILARLPVTPELWRFPIRLPSRRWAIGLAAAAVLALTLVYFRPIALTTTARADLSEIGYARPILATGPTLDLSDAELVGSVLQKVESSRTERDEALSVGADPWQPWTQLYRNLRALGRWDEALSEAYAFVEFAREQDEKPDRYSMYYSGLFELGNIYAAIGDYDKARDYHEQSLVVARNYLNWSEQTGRFADSRPSILARTTAAALVPRFGALSSLAAAEGDMRLAWDYHTQATDLLTKSFRQECIDCGLEVKPSWTLVELCHVVIAGGDAPASLIVKVREHLLREARLHRLDRDLDAAEQTLDTAATLPAYPFADESRLDFNEPMERTQLAIARGDFASALHHADEAAEHLGPREFEGYPAHPPIGIIARAEVLYLKGVALAALNGANPDALRLIDTALASVNETAASFSPTERERFLRLFEDWNSVNKQFGERRGK